MPDGRPNIVVIMTDQQRGDALGCAGHPLLRTPHLDRLAAAGVRFANAFTVAPLCMPARASLLSGTYPHNHGMWSNQASRSNELPPTDETVFGALRRAGYHTGHVGKGHYYAWEFVGHLQEREEYVRALGFDHVHETTGPHYARTVRSRMTDHWEQLGIYETFKAGYGRARGSGPDGRRRPWDLTPNPLSVEEHLDSYVGRVAREFVERYNREQPFALFVGFGGPHEPWDAPGEYATMYVPDHSVQEASPDGGASSPRPAADATGLSEGARLAEPGQRLVSSWDQVPGPLPAAGPAPWVPPAAAERMRTGRIEGLTPARAREVRANYYGKITLIDHWIGEILGAIEQRGWRDDTLVVFLSDHGEMAGDHERLHKVVFYESSIRIPLIVSWTGRTAASAAADGLAESIDVVPTLLEAAGAEPLRRGLGRSLWPALRDPEARVREDVLSEVRGEYVGMGTGWEQPERARHTLMLRTERHKYALDGRGEGYLLHDLESDPDEQVNLIGHPAHHELEAALRERLFRRVVDCLPDR
jgi:arylsulfatase A-like enzyme